MRTGMRKENSRIGQRRTSRDAWIEVQLFGNTVELLLRHFKGIDLS